MEKKAIYIYVRKALVKAHGVQVIVNQIARQVDNIRVVNSLSDVPTGSTVIPYGILESVELIKHRKKYPLILSLLVDAYSLGEKSKLDFFWNKPYISAKQRIRSALKYVKYIVYEHRVLKCFRNVMLVSWGDKRYFQEHKLTYKYANKIVVIPNGISLQQNRPQYARKSSSELIIGCLSPWNDSAFATLQLFLNDIWVKLPTRKGLRLIIAGRYLTEEKKDYISKYENINIMGEVKDLSEFYDAIDVSLLVLVKKCGIINRLLDAFAYQVPVLTRPYSLLSFKEEPTCCYVYNDWKSFQSSVEDIESNPDIVRNKVQIARSLVEVNHNWEKNYAQLMELLK